MARWFISLIWILTLVLAAFAGMRFERAQTPPPVAVATPPPEQNAEPKRPDVLTVLISQGSHFAAIEQAQERLRLTPENIHLRATLAMLYETTHQFDDAIAAYLSIRSLSLDDEQRRQARKAIDQIIRQADERFTRQRSTAEAVAFFERQTVQEPSYDLHRFFLAKWLLKSGAISAAERLVKELGLAGITDTERDSLAAELDRLTTTLPIRRIGSAMYADIEVSTPTGTATLTFLVDTGATMTAVSQYQLRTLGATRTPHVVQAHTANGSIEVSVYELSSISGGPVKLEHFTVGALADLPKHVDGLLGLDFLDQLPVPVVTTRNPL